MEQTKLVLVIGLTFLGLLLWEAWQRDYAVTPFPEIVAQPRPGSAHSVDQPPLNTLTNPPPAIPSSVSQLATEAITVHSDTLELRINLLGGVIEQARLLRYPDSALSDKSPFLMLDNSPTRFFIYQSGLKADHESPDHQARFQATQASYELAQNAESITAILRWQSPAGVLVSKEFTLHRGGYVVGVRYTIDNKTTAPWTFNHYEQLQRKSEVAKRHLINTFTGVAVSSPEQRYNKYTFEKLKDEPVNQEIKNGWAAILEHYFVSALIPSADQTYHYYSSLIGADNYAVGYFSPALTVPPQGQQIINSRLFLGPKLQKLLPSVAPGLELTVDYGLLWFIGKILFWIMAKLHSLIGNWGWSIVLLTCIVKGVFFPLSAAGYRSMAKMRKVQPRLLAIRDRYSNDRARLNQSMMELYKEEKINPLGGCLPIVVQIPVFIALYWVILESVELRDAPWALWIKDLSTKDPYFVLPVLMTISMWLQSKLNPAPMDPIQARVMQFMPFAFGVFFAFFPAGLVLYWFVNNVLSITQQWFITRATA